MGATIDKTGFLARPLLYLELKSACMLFLTFYILDSNLVSSYPSRRHALVPANVVSNKECNSVMGIKYTATRNMICTIDTNAGTCYVSI